MRLAVSLLTIALAACGTVRQTDLDAWKGAPVEALDTHSLFLTMPMVRTVSSEGVEIRNYANGMDVSTCSGGSTATVNRKVVDSLGFATCASQRVQCSNLFYIRAGRVLEYVPTGRCVTDERVQPEKRYMELRRTP